MIVGLDGENCDGTAAAVVAVLSTFYVVMNAKNYVFSFQTIQPPRNNKAWNCFLAAIIIKQECRNRIQTNTGAYVSKNNHNPYMYNRRASV